MRETQQDVAGRELAEMDAQMGRAFGRAPKAVTEADAPVEMPRWLPPMHTQEQWRRHQEQTRLWEAQEAKQQDERMKAYLERERSRLLNESAGTVTRGRVLLQEANAVAPVVTSSGRLMITIITPGWGSSCYYPAAVLEAAVREKIWGAGMHLFVDHPTAREDADRPERSVRDLAAVLTTDARWTGKAVEAEAQLMPQWKATFSDPVMASAIGMSIRGDGEMELGEAEGRKGRILTKLVHGQSIDFVTRAGRGGFYRVAESWRSRWGA